MVCNVYPSSSSISWYVVKSQYIMYFSPSMIFFFFTSPAQYLLLPSSLLPSFLQYFVNVSLCLDGMGIENFWLVAVVGIIIKPARNVISE